MAKLRNKFLVLFAAVMLLALGIFGLTACNGSKDLKVTFMVQNDTTGAWEQYAIADVEDGSVVLPAAPEKDYYTFTNWYANQDYSGEVFTGSDIKESISVYARFVADEVTIVINGENLGTQYVKDVVNGTYDPGENLEFDGWYTDADCTVSWVVGDPSQTLYAHSVARVTFNNGYEDLYSYTVLPGTVLANPKTATASDGVGSQEIGDIVKWYMDKNNVYYADENGQDIDFGTFTVNTNTTINVKWATPFTYTQNSVTGNWYTEGSLQTVISANDRASIPAFSILSEVVYNNQKITVEAIYNASISNYTAVEEIYVSEGIKSIQASFSGSEYNGGALLTKVVLPASLKIIEDSFHFCPILTDIELPEGLEVLINSFDDNGKTKPISGEISVPSTVKNISGITTNFTFENNNNFYKDNAGRIFKRDSAGDILITDPNVENGTLEVPSTVKRIQVGAFDGWGITNLILSDNFQEVCYNASRYDFTYYVTKYAYSCLLFDEENVSAPASYMAPAAISVFSELGNTGVMVIVNAASFDEDLSEYALVGGFANSYKPYTDSTYSSKIAFVGNIDSGEQTTISINFTNWLTEESNSISVNLTSGEKLTEEFIRQSIEIDDLGNDVELTSIKQFGLDYALNQTVTTNLYLDVEWGYTVYAGFTYKTENGNITITGFDENSAYLLEDYNTYLLQIPETIDGKTVTAIADNAFKGNEAISHIYIPSTVKTIGKSAFQDTANLIKVYIKAGGLETIGESAFQNSAFVTIALPVAALKEVGAYAFKSEALQKFMAAEGEEDRVLYTTAAGKTSILYEGIKEGDFFIFQSKHLLRYVATNYERQTDPYNKTTIAVKVYDVQLIAVCGGATSINQNNPYCFGYSMRTSTSAYSGATDFVLRYEIMTGSVYYLNNWSRLEFGIVSKIHENAFTDMNSALSTVRTVYKNCYYVGSSTFVSDSWVTLDQLTSLDASIFEDGWWEGVKKSDENYDDVMKFMTTSSNWASFTGCY